MRLRLQTFSSFKGAVPFKLRLSASEWRFAQKAIRQALDSGVIPAQLQPKPERPAGPDG